MTTTVVIAIELPLLREAVRNWLASIGEFEIVGRASTGPEAISRVEETTPDILLLDVNLPGVGGFDEVRSMAERLPGVDIVVLAEPEERAAMARAVRIGAAGYVTLSRGAGDLIRVLRAVAAGKRLHLPDLSYRSPPAERVDLRD